MFGCLDVCLFVCLFVGQMIRNILRCGFRLALGWWRATLYVTSSRTGNRSGSGIVDVYLLLAHQQTLTQPDERNRSQTMQTECAVQVALAYEGAGATTGIFYRAGTTNVAPSKAAAKTAGSAADARANESERDLMSKKLTCRLEIGTRMYNLSVDNPSAFCSQLAPLLGLPVLVSGTADSRTVIIAAHAGQNYGYRGRRDYGTHADVAVLVSGSLQRPGRLAGLQIIDGWNAFEKYGPVTIH